MTEDKPRSDLLVNGKFSDDELAELSALLAADGVSVHRYVTKGFDAPEVVRVLFEGSSVAIFAKGYLLGKVIDVVLAKAVKWMRKKRPVADLQVGVQIVVRSDSKQFAVNIGVPNGQKSAQFRTSLERTLPADVGDWAEDGEIVSVSWDERNAEAKVLRMPK